MCDLSTTFRFRLYTVVLFLDLRKAFDLVDHTILIKKLDLYGYRGVCNKFLKSYLSDRRQYVSVGSFSSDYVNLTHGVPQGSVLGPFLFNIFINDITLITKSKVILFADDAAFYITDDCFQSCMNKLNQLIEVLFEWATFNRLVPNIRKTKLMLITPRIVPDLPIVLFNGIELEWVDSFKYLGTVIDRKLNFNCHVDQVCKSLSKMRGVIYAVSDLIPSNILLTLYKSLVLPLLINNIIIWGCTGVTNVNRLTISVNKILRLILKVKYNENNVPLMPVNEMYKHLKILKFIDLHRYFLLKFAHNALYNDCDMFEEFISPFLSLSHTRNWINLPIVRTEVERRFVVFQMCKLLREMPPHLIQPQSLSILRRNYYEYSLANY